MKTSDDEQIREQVRAGYSAIAKKGVFEVMNNEGCCTSGGCCGSSEFDVGQLVASMGYTAEQLANIPAGANMGLSCGNPTAITELKPGEVVLDLGSGGGFDAFIAGPRVGASGRVIGVDMTPDMLSKARKNIAAYKESSALDNVEFRLGEIEHLPVADNSIDVVISNCVLNLSPDKPQVWREIYRVLKPGGRVAISDLALLQPLPQSVTQMVEALVGCVAGAVLVNDIKSQAEAAGLKSVKIVQKSEYIETLTGFEDPLYQKILEHLPAGHSLSEFITSADITANK